MGKQYKQWQTLFSWAPKSPQMVTAAMKLKRHSLEETLWQTWTLYSKQKHYFAKKGLSGQSYHFPRRHVRVGPWRKAGQLRIDVFELWCWRRLLKVPWTSRRSNQSTLREISPEYSLEGLMLKLKLQSVGHLMRRADSSEKTLMLWKVEGRRRGDDRGWDG